MSVTFRGADGVTQALQSGKATPRALATGDLDGNGTPDLVTAYAYGETGIVTIQRGNPDAFAPTDDSVFERLVQGYNPESFLPDAEVYPVPVPADFLAVGNFDHQFGQDILFAAKGGGLYLMAGEGGGRFGATTQIQLPGTVTALGTGEFRAADGFADVAVGISAGGGSALWIFDGAEAFSEPLVQYELPEPPVAIELGSLDDDPFQDVTVAAGKEIVVIHGSGRKAASNHKSQIERIPMPFQIRSLALGFFVWERKARTQIAVLADDGSIQIHTRGKLDARPFSEEELQARTRGRLSARGKKVDLESTPAWTESWSEGWTPAREFTAGNAVGAGTDSQLKLLSSHLSFREIDSLLLLGDNQNKVGIVTQAERDGDVAVQSVSGTPDDMKGASLDMSDEPVAVLSLPQKLNGERNIVVLQKNSPSAVLVPQAANFYIVDFTGGGNNPFADGNDSSTHGGSGTMADPFHMANLRGAVTAANSNDGSTIILPAGTYILSINGTGAGGCDGNAAGDLEANASMTITGAGSATTIIRQQGTGPANDGDRIMCMNNVFAVGLVYNFSGVTFVGGREGTAAGGGAVLGGAGIIGGELDNSLTLTNVVFANNQETVSGSANLGGGGLQITGGNLIITNSTFGGTSGPGLYTDRSSTNTANSQAGSGGGITYTPSSPKHTGGTGTLTITGSTFSRNTSAGIGGGGADLLIFAFASPGGIGSGTANISTSTFSNNQAANGGGIVVESLPTTVATTNFTNNSATNRGGGIYVGGGSLLLNGTSPSITFSGNTATNAGSSVSTAAPVNVDGTNTTIGGDIEVSQGGTWTNNAGSTLAPTNVVVAGGVLNMNNSTMNVSGNLTIGPGGTNGGTFNGNTGTVNIQGNFVLNAGGSSPATNLTAGTGTFNFNGTGAQSISNGTSITFFNLTDSNVTQPLTFNNSFAVDGSLSANGTNAILSPVAGAVINGTGTLTGTGTALVSRIAATPDFLTQYSITNKTLTNLTIDYSGAGNQTVNNTPAYSQLRLSGSGIKTLQGNTVITSNLNIISGSTFASGNFNFALGGNWTNGGTFSPGTGTVTFQGSTGTQLITGNTIFFNLTLNNTGATTNFGNTTTTVGNDLVASAGTMDGGASTIVFTGVTDNAGSISGAAAKNFHNLQINSPATISHSAGANITIENNYVNTGTFTQGAGLTTIFDVDNAADGAHTLSGAGTTTFGNFTINGSNTVDAGSHSFNVVGASFTVTGTFTGNTSTVTFNGAVAQAIAGNGTKNFSGLTINNASGVTVNDTTPAVDALVSGVSTLTTNLTIAAGAILQQSGTSAGAADAIGTVRRTDLNIAGAKPFGNPFNTIAVDSGTAPAQMDVTLAMTSPADFTTAVARTYTLTPAGGSGISATVKLHYLDSQLNGNTETKLGLWKKPAAVWVIQGRSAAVDTVNNAVTLSGVTSFSGWTLADMPDVSVAVSPSSVAEDGATNLVYTFTRTGSTGFPLGVNFAVSGTATLSTDYTQTGADTFTASSGTVTIPSGSSTATVTIDPTADITVETDETAILTVSPGTTYNVVAPSTATGTITNDDTDVTVGVAPSSVAEDGAPNLVYTFTRVGVTSGALTVNFSVGGTAAFSTDYTQTGAATFTATAGTVTFGAGNTTATVTVDPSADTTVESDETVILTITPGTGYNVANPGAATGTITNDDTDVSVAVSPSSVAEDGAPNLVYTFTRTGVTAGVLTVNLSVGGTATFNTDYTQTGAATFTSSSGTVTMGAGNSTATVTVDPSADSSVEPDETVILTVTSGTGYNVGVPSAATGTITNDDTDVSVAVAPSSVAEDGATNLVYTFTRNGVTTGALTVNFSVGGTATFNTDYAQSGADTFTASTGTVTIATGNTTATVTLDPTVDASVESDETVILTLTSGTGYNVGAPSSATGTITNDDTDVSVAVSPASTPEDGVANLVFTFTRTGLITGPLTANFSIGGTATFNTDYTQTGAATFTPPTGTVTFTGTNATATVTVDPSADNTVEPDETVILTVTSGTGYNLGAPSAATGTIATDDANVTVAVSPASVAEDGSTNLVYTFTRAGFTGAALTVNFTIGGTATFSTDYTQTGAATFVPPNGSVTFSGSNTTTTVTVDPAVDSTGEPDETVVLTLVAGSNYTVGAPGAATGTILNDDTAVSVVVSPGSVAEDGAINMLYTFTRTGDTTASLLVNFSVGGSATFNTDYTQTGADSFDASTGTITIGVGSSTATVTVDPSVDSTVEPDESVILTVTAGAGYAPGPPTSATGTITNDDTEVTVTVSPSSVSEDGATNLVFTFTRTGVTTGALTANFTVGGTATFTTDYTQSGAATFGATDGSVSFGAGNMNAIVTVDPSADSIVESDETVLLTVTSGGGYGVGTPASASGTISNDDTDVSVTVAPSSVLEDGATNLVYTFSRTGVTATPLTVNFSVSGTATFSSDYTQTGAASFSVSSGTVTIGASNSTATITVDPSADLTPEPDETVILMLTAGSGYSAVNPDTATGTILTDDTDVSVTVSPASTSEDGAGTLVYTFTRVGITAGSLTVNFSVGGPATFGTDYSQTGADTFSATIGTVTFGAGNTTTMVTVDPAADSTVEPDETVLLTVTAGPGYNPAAPVSATGTIVNDDTDVSVTVAPASVVENSGNALLFTFTRTGVTNGALTVNFTIGGTATLTADYTQGGAASFVPPNGAINIADGNSTAVVIIAPVADGDVEPDETVIFNVAAGAGYNIAAANNSATGTITNDDTDVTLSVSPASVGEDGATPLVYTFTRSGVTTGALTVNFTVGGTASFSVDYGQSGAATFSATTGSVSIGDGNTMATVPLTPINDVKVEGNETASLTLSASASYDVGTPGAVTGTIVDNDAATLAFDAATSNAPEQTTPHLAGVQLVIVANGSGTPTLDRVVTVNVQNLLTGSATNSGTDYTYSPNPQTLTFNPGDVSGTIRNVSIPIVNDLFSEGNETINLSLNTLTDDTGGQVALTSPTSRTVTIVDNDIDLKVTKAESADPVAAGGGPGNLTYTITVKNNGLTVATGVTLSETLTIPAGVTVDSVMGSAGTTVTPIDSTHYTWSVGTLAVGNMTTLSAVLTVGPATAAGTNTLCDTATVTASNEVRVNTGDDSATECTSVVAQADVEITAKTDSPDPVCVLGDITYTIGYRNNGPGPGLNAQVSDSIPANTTLVSATTASPGWGRTDAVPAGGTGTIVFSKSSSPNSETASFQIVVRVNAGTPSGGIITNTATAGSTLVDPVPGNNGKSTTSTVDPIAPTFSCSGNVTALTNQNTCSLGGCQMVNYALPTAMDNCPGVQVVCVPPSGTCMPTGTTTVACTATDAAGNTANCSFGVTVFDVCLQDDSNSNTVLLFNSQTGQYKFCCSRTTYTGTGTVLIKGCTISLNHNAGDRRLTANVDKTQFKGTASFQSPPGVTKCSIIDRDLRNNSCNCP